MFLSPPRLHSLHFCIRRYSLSGTLVLLVIEPTLLIITQYGKAFWDGRRSNRGGRAFSVPVCYRRHLVSQMVPVAVFDRDIDLVLESDRVFNVQHIAGLVAVGVFLVDR